VKPLASRYTDCAAATALNKIRLHYEISPSISSRIPHIWQSSHSATAASALFVWRLRRAVSALFVRRSRERRLSCRTRPSSCRPHKMAERSAVISTSCCTDYTENISWLSRRPAEIGGPTTGRMKSNLTCGSVVRSGIMLQDERSRCRIPMGSLDFCNLPNLCSRIMALGFTQSLTEMNTRNRPGG
jgi:hypothetical protein